MTTLAQDLGGVVRLLEKATPGEWRVSGECVVFDDRRLVCCGRGRYECCGDPDVDGAEHPIVGLLGGNPNISDVETIAAAVNFLRTHSAEIAGALRDAERLDYIERTFTGMSNGERYLPRVMGWGKSRNGRTLREACDKYMQRESAMQQGGGGGGE